MIKLIIATLFFIPQIATGMNNSGDFGVYKDFRNTGTINGNDTGIAMKGYDPVSYFDLKNPTDNPKKGTAQFSYKYKTATYFFSSQENLDKFKANPEKFEPQHGGFCSYAMSAGAFADADPLAWNISNGKLYLNKNETARRYWLDQQAHNKVLADRHWHNFRNYIPKDFICANLTASHTSRFLLGASAHLKNSHNGKGHSILNGLFNTTNSITRFLVEDSENDDFREKFMEFAFNNNEAYDIWNSQLAATVCKYENGKYSLKLGRNKTKTPGVRCRYIDYPLLSVYNTLGGNT